MTPEQIAELKRDYLVWSGGILPDKEQIEIYLECSVATNLPEDEVRTILEGWESRTTFRE